MKIWKLLILGTTLSVMLTACNTDSGYTESVSSAESDNSRIETNMTSALQNNTAGEMYTYVSTETTVSELIRNPNFENFGQYLLPIKTRSFIDETMRIDNINSLLPYHNYIQTDTTVEILNYLIGQINKDETVFYDIYSEQQKQENPDKEATGLFFFRGEPNAPFAIICAGGGFSYVGSIHESFPHALELSKKGYNAFALEYRVGGAEPATEDLAAAISFIFEHAAELEVNTNGYSVWGGSAGARMAAYIGSYGPAHFGGDDLPRPSAVVMQYTGHTDYTENDPPTYACIGENDGIASWQTMERRINTLSQLGIDTEFHKYPNLGHGFGLGLGTSAEGWIRDAIAFWEKQLNVLIEDD